MRFAPSFFLPPTLIETLPYVSSHASLPPNFAVRPRLWLPPLSVLSHRPRCCATIQTSSRRLAAIPYVKHSCRSICHPKDTVTPRPGPRPPKHTRMAEAAPPPPRSRSRLLHTVATPVSAYQYQPSARLSMYAHRPTSVVLAQPSYHHPLSTVPPSSAPSLRLLQSYGTDVGSRRTMCTFDDLLAVAFVPHHAKSTPGAHGSHRRHPHILAHPAVDLLRSSNRGQSAPSVPMISVSSSRGTA